MPSSATGTGTFTLIGNQLTYQVSYSGLSSPAVAAHLHGPADAAGTAGVLQGLNGASGTSGTLSGSLILTPDQLAHLIDGLVYVNVHSSEHPGGEIRGQLAP